MDDISKLLNDNMNTLNKVCKHNKDIIKNLDCTFNFVEDSPFDINELNFYSEESIFVRSGHFDQHFARFYILEIDKFDDFIFSIKHFHKANSFELRTYVLSFDKDKKSKTDIENKLIKYLSVVKSKHFDLYSYERGYEKYSVYFGESEEKHPLFFLTDEFIKIESEKTILLLNSIEDIVLTPFEESKSKIAEELKLKIIFDIAQGN